MPVWDLLLAQIRQPFHMFYRQSSRHLICLLGQLLVQIQQFYHQFSYLFGHLLTCELGLFIGLHNLTLLAISDAIASFCRILDSLILRFQKKYKVYNTSNPKGMYRYSNPAQTLWLTTCPYPSSNRRASRIRMCLSKESPNVLSPASRSLKLGNQKRCHSNCSHT